MSKGFWKQLKKPILAVAPMADVTDVAFRRIYAKYGKPDVIWTEFVSCDGLCSKEGRKALVRNLKYVQAERPIVAQIFGSNPDTFYECAKLVRELGFDGVDINMGCPEKSICKAGSGAALFNTPKIAKQIIKETKRGAGPLPVSVKIRTGYGREGLKAWLEELISAKPDAIIIHARTRKEMSKVPADWELLGKTISDLRKKYPQRSLPLFLGNGDVSSLDEAHQKAERYGLDGIMVGRGVFGNPWFFNPKIDPTSITLQDKLKVMLEHAQLYDKLVKHKPFDIMKKHFKAYIHGFDGAKDLRIKLMATQSASDVEAILKAEHLIN